jgi:hypothetical protein
MAINFPINPSNGDTYVVGEVTFTYNSTKSIWSSEIITDPISLSLSLSDITNVSSTSPTEGQVLSYDVTNTEWINTTPIDAYTKTEVDTAIGNVSVDLSGYDTSVQVDTKIAAIPDTDLSAYDTSAQVDTKVASIVDSAPETLNTLNELAAALGDDANHVSTMTTLVGTKADQSTTYTKTEVDTSLNLKSDKTTTYTKTEVDTSLNLKSDKTTTYTKTEVDSAVLSSWTEDANGHILPNVNDTHDIGSSTLKVRDIYMSGSTIHLGDQIISADADGIKMPAIKIGTGANAVSLSASSDGKLVQTATVGGVVQTPTSSTGASVIVSDTPPSSPSSGDLWTDSTTMKMFIYYEDADSSQWVGVSGSSGADGADGDIGPAGPVGPSGGLSVHLTPLDLPTTGSTGDQAYVESNTSIYVYDENITGWYRVALINQTPTYTSTPDAMYIFATDGTPIIVTPVAEDPEGSLVTYSVVGDMGTVATMTQDDNAFTFTPSTDAANAGEFNITFRVTDGTNVADAISNFTLSFGPDLGSWTTSGLTHHWDVSSFDISTDTTWIDKVSGVVLQNSGSVPTVGGNNDNDKYFNTSPSAYPYWISTELGLYKQEQTLEIWAYYDGSPDGYIFSLDSQYPQSLGPYGISRAIRILGGSLSVVGYGTSAQDQNSIYPLSVNVWVQMTFVYSSITNLTVYVNGVDKGTFTKSLLDNGGDRLVIGAAPWSSTQIWGGRYSNFKMYDRALSSTEVVYNFDGQKSRWGY